MALPGAERRSDAIFWIISAFGVALLLAVCVLGIAGTSVRGIHAALAVTGRLSFQLFWPAYVGGALVTLFGPGLQPVRRNGRKFGFAFASAHLVHLGLVCWLCVIGAAPAAGVFVLFGIATFSLYLLVVVSVPAIAATLASRDWRLLRLVAMTYIAYAFAVDFLSHPQVAGIRTVVAYLPFSVLVTAGFLLRLAAFFVEVRAQPSRQMALPRV